MVFVYGTLRNHERNSHYLWEAERIARQAWISGTLFDTGYGYPTFRLGGEGTVYGELYKLNEDTLQKVNALEGFKENGTNNLYDRVKVSVQTANEAVDALVYTAGPGLSHCKVLIEGGDWKVHQFFNQSVEEATE